MYNFILPGELQILVSLYFSTTDSRGIIFSKTKINKKINKKCSNKGTLNNMKLDILIKCQVTNSKKADRLNTVPVLRTHETGVSVGRPFVFLEKHIFLINLIN